MERAAPRIVDQHWWTTMVKLSVLTATRSAVTAEVAEAAKVEVSLAGAFRSTSPGTSPPLLAPCPE